MTAPDEAEWVVEGAQRGCVVIAEADPQPGALLGKMAFGGFNPETERLQVQSLSQSKLHCKGSRYPVSNCALHDAFARI
jgi:hypothetical protein